ncbi:CASTOR/POLLUX-related putative ion channel [Micropruina sonneratiae]|uniref:CASTOR/POLLUX-related putative ion channel n=1 Tax=Micropruina sonneratiae TaxID=2986940 RepID=UPI002226E5D2|nr:NAD-binding protein [Micropruina sp. KQZ13P-5]MCW3156979.1 NAD-binding protein [Micropruina sp. KQZ13P-5]
MQRPSMRERLRYAFDNVMSRGTVAIMGLLALATVGFVFAVAVLVMVLKAFPDDADDGDFWDVVWGNLMRTLDPGTMGADAGWGFRLLMLLVTVGGLIIVASLIGIVSGAFDDKMAQLRKGRSRVIESGHTLILGWSPQLFLLIGEICRANAGGSGRHRAIVVLAAQDKVAMEDAIREKVPHTGRTRIICRTGDPTSPADLQLGSPLAARSIVVLSGDQSDPDAAAIKTALALTHALPEGAGVPIVAALADPDNLDAARLVGREASRWLPASTLVHRLTAQTCRQRGLSTVYADLLDFAGDELYFAELPELVGTSYAEALVRFADSAVLGIVRGSSIMLNPAGEVLLAEGDQLVVLARDAAPIRLSKPGRSDPDALGVLRSSPPTPEHTLIIGQRAGLQEVLSELVDYLPEGSQVCVVAGDERMLSLAAPEAVEVQVVIGDTTSRTLLWSLELAQYDHIVVLADADAADPQVADARTLVTLLHLRDIADRADLRLNIVSEMLDDRNRELAEVARADDFIVSDRLVGLMLAQASENPRLIDVFDELFRSEGNEIYLRPAELYLRAEAETTFYTVVTAAVARGETAIGYRLAAESWSREASYGVHLNPAKGDRIRLGPDDSVIVLAQDEH